MSRFRIVYMPISAGVSVPLLWIIVYALMGVKGWPFIFGALLSPAFGGILTWYLIQRYMAQKTLFSGRVKEITALLSLGIPAALLMYHYAFVSDERREPRVADHPSHFGPPPDVSAHIPPPIVPVPSPSAPPIPWDQVLERVLLGHRPEGGWRRLADSMPSPLTIAKEGTYLLPISGLGVLPKEGVSVKTHYDRRQGMNFRPNVFYLGPYEYELLAGYQVDSEQFGVLLPTGAVFVSCRKVEEIVPVKPVDVGATITGEAARKTSIRLVWENQMVPEKFKSVQVLLGEVPLIHDKDRLGGQISFWVGPPVDPTTRQAQVTQLRPEILQEVPVEVEFKYAGHTVTHFLRKEVLKLTFGELREDFRKRHGIEGLDSVMVRIKAYYPITCHIGLVVGEEKR